MAIFGGIQNPSVKQALIDAGYTEQQISQMTTHEAYREAGFYSPGGTQAIESPWPDRGIRDVPDESWLNALISEYTGGARSSRYQAPSVVREQLAESYEGEWAPGPVRDFLETLQPPAGSVVPYPELVSDIASRMGAGPSSHIRAEIRVRRATANPAMDEGAARRQLERLYPAPGGGSPGYQLAMQVPDPSTWSEPGGKLPPASSVGRPRVRSHQWQGNIPGTFLRGDWQREIEREFGEWGISPAQVNQTISQQGFTSAREARDYFRRQLDYDWYKRAEQVWRSALPSERKEAFGTSGMMPKTMWAQSPRHLRRRWADAVPVSQMEHDDYGNPIVPEGVLLRSEDAAYGFRTSGFQGTAFWAQEGGKQYVTFGEGKAQKRGQLLGAHNYVQMTGLPQAPDFIPGGTESRQADYGEVVNTALILGSKESGNVGFIGPGVGAYDPRQLGVPTEIIYREVRPTARHKPRWYAPLGTTAKAGQPLQLAEGAEPLRHREWSQRVIAAYSLPGGGTGYQIQRFEEPPYRIKFGMGGTKALGHARPNIVRSAREVGSGQPIDVGLIAGMKDVQGAIYNYFRAMGTEHLRSTLAQYRGVGLEEVPEVSLGSYSGLGREPMEAFMQVHAPNYLKTIEAEHILSAENLARARETGSLVSVAEELPGGKARAWLQYQALVMPQAIQAIKQWSYKQTRLSAEDFRRLEEVAPRAAEELAYSRHALEMRERYGQMVQSFATTYGGRRVPEGTVSPEQMDIIPTWEGAKMGAGIIAESMGQKGEPSLAQITDQFIGMLADTKYGDAPIAIRRPELPDVSWLTQNPIMLPSASTLQFMGAGQRWEDEELGGFIHSARRVLTAYASGNMEELQAALLGGEGHEGYLDLLRERGMSGELLRKATSVFFEGMGGTMEGSLALDPNESYIPELAGNITEGLVKIGRSPIQLAALGLNLKNISRREQAVDLGIRSGDIVTSNTFQQALAGDWDGDTGFSFLLGMLEEDPETGGAIGPNGERLSTVAEIRQAAQKAMAEGAGKVVEATAAIGVNISMPEAAEWLKLQVSRARGMTSEELEGEYAHSRMLYSNIGRFYNVFRRMEATMPEGAKRVHEKMFGISHGQAQRPALQPEGMALFHSIATGMKAGKAGSYDPQAQGPRLIGGLGPASRGPSILRALAGQADFTPEDIADMFRTSRSGDIAGAVRAWRSARPEERAVATRDLIKAAGFGRPGGIDAYATESYIGRGVEPMVFGRIPREEWSNKGLGEETLGTIEELHEAQQRRIQATARYRASNVPEVMERIEAAQDVFGHGLLTEKISPVAEQARRSRRTRVVSKEDLPSALPELKEGFTRLVHMSNKPGLHEILQSEGEGLDYSRQGTIDATVRGWSDPEKVEYGIEGDPRFQGTAYIFDVPEQVAREHMGLGTAPGKLPNKYYVGSAEPVDREARDKFKLRLAGGAGAEPQPAGAGNEPPTKKPPSVASAATEEPDDDDASKRYREYHERNEEKRQRITSSIMRGYTEGNEHSAFLGFQVEGHTVRPVYNTKPAGGGEPEPRPSGSRQEQYYVEDPDRFRKEAGEAGIHIFPGTQKRPQPKSSGLTQSGVDRLKEIFSVQEDVHPSEVYSVLHRHLSGMPADMVTWENAYQVLEAHFGISPTGGPPPPERSASPTEASPEFTETPRQQPVSNESLRMHRIAGGRVEFYDPFMRHHDVPNVLDDVGATEMMMPAAERVLYTEGPLEGTQRQLLNRYSSAIKKLRSYEWQDRSHLGVKERARVEGALAPLQGLWDEGGSLEQIDRRMLEDLLARQPGSEYQIRQAFNQPGVLSWLNQATAGQLQNVKGIGPARAQRLQRVLSEDLVAAGAFGQFLHPAQAIEAAGEIGVPLNQQQVIQMQQGMVQQAAMWQAGGQQNIGGAMGAVGNIPITPLNFGQITSFRNQLQGNLNVLTGLGGEVPGAWQQQMAAMQAGINEQEKQVLARRAGVQSLRAPIDYEGAQREIDAVENVFKRIKEPLEEALDKLKKGVELKEEDNELIAKGIALGKRREELAGVRGVGPGEVTGETPSGLGLPKGTKVDLGVGTGAEMVKMGAELETRAREAGWEGPPEPGRLERFLRRLIPERRGLYSGDLGQLAWGMFNIQRAWRYTGGQVQSWMQDYAGYVGAQQQTMAALGGGAGYGGLTEDILSQQAGLERFTLGLGKAGWQNWGWVTELMGGKGGLPQATVGSRALTGAAPVLGGSISLDLIGRLASKYIPGVAGSVLGDTLGIAARLGSTYGLAAVGLGLGNSALRQAIGEDEEGVGFLKGLGLLPATASALNQRWATGMAGKFERMGMPKLQKGFERQAERYRETADWRGTWFGMEPEEEPSPEQVAFDKAVASVTDKYKYISPTQATELLRTYGQQAGRLPWSEDWGARDERTIGALGRLSPQLGQQVMGTAAGVAAASGVGLGSPEISEWQAWFVGLEPAERTGVLRNVDYLQPLREMYRRAGDTTGGQLTQEELLSMGTGDAYRIGQLGRADPYVWSRLAALGPQSIQRQSNFPGPLPIPQYTWQETQQVPAYMQTLEVGQNIPTDTGLPIGRTTLAPLIDIAQSLGASQFGINLGAPRVMTPGGLHQQGASNIPSALFSQTGGALPLPGGGVFESPVGGTLGMELWQADAQRVIYDRKYALQQADASRQWDYQHNLWGIQQNQANLQYGYQRQQFGFQEQQLDLSDWYFNQQQAMQREQITTQAQWQREAMARQGQQMETRYGWQLEDLSFQGARAGLEFGWQMEDIGEAMRYATGRQRRDLMKQRERATIRYGMSMGQLGEKEGRVEEEREWAREAHEEAKSHHEKQVEWQMERLELSSQYHSRNMDMQRERLQASREYFEENHRLQEQARDLQRTRWKENFASLQEATQITRDYHTWLNNFFQPTLRNIQMLQELQAARIERLFAIDGPLDRGVDEIGDSVDGLLDVAKDMYWWVRSIKAESGGIINGGP